MTTTELAARHTGPGQTTYARTAAELSHHGVRVEVTAAADAIRVCHCVGRGPLLMIYSDTALPADTPPAELERLAHELLHT